MKNSTLNQLSTTANSLSVVKIHLVLTVLVIMASAGLLHVDAQTIKTLPTLGAGTAVAAGTNCIIYDAGGATGNYANSSTGYLYLTALAGQTITVSGSYETESTYDFIRVFTGNGTAGTRVINNSGTGYFTYTGAAGIGLTVQLTSDGSTVYSGVKLIVTYSPTPTLSVPSTGSNSVACGTSTVLFDHAGRATNYSNSVDGYTVLNNSGTGVINLAGSYYTESTYDLIRIYNGSGTGGTLLATYSGSGAGNTAATTLNYTGTAGQILTVRFSSDGSTTYAGFEIGATYTGACAVACTPPTTQASGVNATPIGQTTATVTATRGSGNGIIIVAYPGATAGTVPASGTAYTANAAYGTAGTALGTGYVVYSGTAASPSVPVTGLTAGTQYTFVAYEYATTGTCYNTATTATKTIITIPSCVSAGVSPANGASGICYTGTGAVSNISWTAVTGATSYDVYFGTSPTPPLVSSSQAGTTSSVTITASTTYYWKVIPKNATGSAPSCGTYSFTTKAAPCYCTPSGSTSANTYISNFTITGGTANFNSSSGYTSTPVAGYADYTSTYSATQAAGSSVSFSLTYVGGTAGLAVFADWNQDGDFLDAGETVSTSGGYVAAGTYTGTIAVPLTATVGTTRIRVIANYNASTPTSCVAASTARGEAEDYSFVICTSLSVSDPTISTQTVCKNGTLTALTVTSAGATGYQWYSNTTASNSGGSPVTTGSGYNTNTFTPSNTVGSALYYYVVATSSCTSATSAVSGLITVNAPYTPLPVTGTTTVCVGGTTTLASTLPSGGDSVYTTGTYPNSYNVHMFKSGGTFTVPAGLTDLSAEVLVVGGGGGGGSNGGGGGGGGGLKSVSSVSIPAGATTVTVGGGGAAAASSSVPGSNGSPSSLGTLVTALGGGGGGSRDGGAGGQDGGSGGGGGGASAITGTCSPAGVSLYADDYFDPYITTPISCLPTGATITNMSLSVSVTDNAYCGNWFLLEWSADGFLTSEIGCSGTYTSTLWNGLTNGSTIYLGLDDWDGYDDYETFSINSSTVISYTAPGTRYLGGAGATGQGKNGGNGTTPDAGCNSAGGGGGGAGGIGSLGTGSGISSAGGAGGAGLSNSITGGPVAYAGGGGGGTTGYIGCGTVTSITNGAGGTGGGSNGESGISGGANRGGGGGAETAGGSGIVIVKYPAGQWSSSNTGVATVDQNGVVTGVAGGTATITYTVAIGSCTSSVSTVVTVPNSAANVQLATSSVNGITLTEQCTEATGWTYYANPAAPNAWLFGIYKNTNSIVPNVTITVNSSYTETKDNARQKATYTMKRYWNVTLQSGSIAPGKDVQVRFFYDGSDTSAMRTAANSLASSYGLSTNRINGIEWFKTSPGYAFTPSTNNYSTIAHKLTPSPTVVYGTSAMNGIAYVDYQGLQGFSGGTGGLRLSPGAYALPVTLLYVTATPVDNSLVRVDWATASEISNKGFELERSSDGVTFEKIGWIDGHGNSNQTIEYSYSDKTVSPNSIYYYRLKQIDVDGESDYSDIVSASIISKNGFVLEELRPNPASDKVNIQVVALAAQDATITVTDMLGREAVSQNWQIAEGYNGVDVITKALGIGTYNVIVKTQSQYFIKKLIISR